VWRRTSSSNCAATSRQSSAPSSGSLETPRARRALVTIVPGETGVAAEARERFDGCVVQAEIEDRIHHAGHRDASAAAHRDQQRVRQVAEALAGAALEIAHRGFDLVLQSARELAVRRVVGDAGFGRDREAGRHGQAGTRHLRQAGTLAAQQVSHLTRTLLEGVDALGRRQQNRSPRRGLKLIFLA
jgi:hypothetical protein